MVLKDDNGVVDDDVGEEDMIRKERNNNFGRWKAAKDPPNVLGLQEKNCRVVADTLMLKPDSIMMSS